MILSALASCGGGGDSGSPAGGVEADGDQAAEVDRLLTRSEALELMSQGLSAVQSDVQVRARVTPNSNFTPVGILTCDKLGVHTSTVGQFSVCQIYDEEGEEGGVSMSPDGVDLVSRVPAGTVGQVMAAVAADLAGVGAPVLRMSSTCDFGHFEWGERVFGQFIVQAGRAEDITAGCETVDSGGRSAGRPLLNVVSTEGREVTFGFETSVQFGTITLSMIATQVTLRCTFSARGASTAATAAGHFFLRSDIPARPQACQ